MLTRQTNHHRLPVRLPPEIHEKLIEYANEKDCSLNAAIVSILDERLIKGNKTQLEGTSKLSDEIADKVVERLKDTK